MRDNLPLCAHRIYGTGAPLLILHGLLGSADNWRTIATQLAETATVCVPDLRNHGRSFHHVQHDYPSMVADCLRLMDALGFEQIDVIGHSMGGKVAMQLAAAYPERVRRLMVVDIAPRQYPDLHTDLMRAMLAIPVASIDSRTAVENALSATIPCARTRAFLMMNLARATSGLEWRVNLPTLLATYPDICAGVELPRLAPSAVCWVRGDRSNYLTQADCAAFQQHFPGCIIETITEAGHWPHADNPSAFLSICRRFFV